MSLILVVDDQAVIREPIAAALKSAGHDAICAGGGREAIELIKKRVPDLILLDLTMPDMNGMLVLRTLRNQTQTVTTPVILLTATADKERIIEARRWGVHDYILKTQFSLPQLLARVAKCLTPANGTATPLASELNAAGSTHEASSSVVISPNLVSRQECTRRAEEAMQAKTLSGVVAQVISLATSPQSDLTHLASVIARDSVLSSRVLRAANSAAYATKRGPVSAIADAVRNLGCSAIRGIATSIAIFDAMPPSSGDGFNAIRCWQHSFATAVLCEQLAGGDVGQNSGIAYLVGLCHDLGEILIRTHFAKEYQQIIEVAEREKQSVHDLFPSMLGMPYGELVSIVLSSVGLPESIREPIEAFHTANANGEWPISQLARVLAIADAHATAAQLAPTAAAPLRSFTRAECQAAIGAETVPPIDVPTLRGRVVSLTALLAQLSTSEEAELVKPLFAPARLKVSLIRDSFYSHFDPIETALRGLCRVELADNALKSFALTSDQHIIILSAGAEFDQHVADHVLPIFKAIPPSHVLWASRSFGTKLNSNPTNLPRVPFPVTLRNLHTFVAPTSPQIRQSAA